MPLPAIVTDVPGATTALTTIASKLASFDASGKDIVAMMHQAAVLKGNARTAGDTATLQKADASLTRLQALYKTYGTIDDQLAPVRDWLHQQGFGVVIVPVIVAVAAVAAIVGMTYVIEQAGSERKELDLLSVGKITPEQLTALRAQTQRPPLVNVDFGAIVPWVIGGAVLYFGVPKLLEALKQKRRAGAAA